MADQASTKYSDILCIGLGVSGVCLAAQLKRRRGFSDIHFYDRNQSHSGTWRVNRYPGCACDVPGVYYSFSFELNPDWSRLLPSNEEIQTYLDGVVDKYQLASQMTFRTECELAKWDGKRQIWSVYLRNLDTRETFIHECRLLLTAVGVLVDGKEPDILGKDVFKGPIFHTSRWRSDVDLRDKNVVIIGNGSSATQTVPVIAPMTKTLTQFVRSPHWIFEFENITFGPGARGAFRRIPLLSRLFRLFLFLRLEKDWLLFKMDKIGASMRKSAEAVSKEFIRQTAPEKYHDILIPDWGMGCKRRVLDSDGSYLKSLNAPNVHLTNDPIVEILPAGVRTASKTYPADIIIFATGFNTNNGLGNLRIEGRDSELHDHWRKVGGPGAYNCTAVHGFPNFFMIYGPNSTTGHNSVLFAVENMILYMFKIIDPILKGEASEVEIKEEPYREYVQRVQDASSDRIWNSCRNWYVKDGWNSTLYPWSQMHFWWRSVFPKWNDWSYKYTNKKRPSRGGRILATFFLVLFALTIAGSLKSPHQSWWPPKFLISVPSFVWGR